MKAFKKTDLIKAAVSQTEMEQVYDAIKTPFKYGIILEHEGELTDSPSVFYKDGFWYMLYTVIDMKSGNSGYDAYLAQSADLLHWTKKGRVLSRGSGNWDDKQCDGIIALQDINFEGNYGIEKYNGRYWMTYLGGNLIGYETDPLSLGVAWTKRSELAEEWTKEKDPILKPGDSDARKFENCTLYRSFVFRDETNSLGFPFVMYYNAKENETGIERIGMAASDDMLSWKRYGDNPVVDIYAKKGYPITGDPQILKIGNLWVMNYYICDGKTAFDTFACSKDLINWTTWEGEPTIKSTEDFDTPYAHKPYIIKNNDTVYHYYCAVSANGRRAIALATSRKIKTED